MNIKNIPKEIKPILFLLLLLWFGTISLLMFIDIINLIMKIFITIYTLAFISFFSYFLYKRKNWARILLLFFAYTKVLKFIAIIPSGVLNKNISLPAPVIIIGTLIFIFYIVLIVFLHRKKDYFLKNVDTKLKEG